mgnify:CR=1 FL=1
MLAIVTRKNESIIREIVMYKFPIINKYITRQINIKINFIKSKLNGMKLINTRNEIVDTNADSIIDIIRLFNINFNLLWGDNVMLIKTFL